MAKIYLLGARGCGKTTVGKQVAMALDVPFYDLDEEIVKTVGRSIAEMVADAGWAEFRRQEADILRKIAAICENGVISTGGGIVLDSWNRDFMKADGITIWLDVPAERLHARLSEKPDADSRPSLTGKGLLEEISEILEQRKPLYQDCGSHIVSADRPVRDICNDIVSLIREKA